MAQMLNKASIEIRDPTVRIQLQIKHRNSPKPCPQDNSRGTYDLRAKQPPQEAVSN